MAINTELLLFIEPKKEPSKKPVINELTKKMTASLRKAQTGTILDYDVMGQGYIFEKDEGWMGWHTCSCDAISSGVDYLLTNGEMTNSLCIHYLAYHREEIPQDQLDRVFKLNDGQKKPKKKELDNRFN